MLPDPMFSHQASSGKLPGYDVVMLVYLITGAALLPMFIGELLVDAGLIEAMSEKSTPPWVYAYTVFVTFAGAFALFVAWIPAIVICFKYRRRWRAVVPAVAVLVCTASVFFVESSQTAEYVAATAAIGYAFIAFVVGVEWLVKSRR